MAQQTIDVEVLWRRVGWDWWFLAKSGLATVKGKSSEECKDCSKRQAEHDFVRYLETLPSGNETLQPVFRHMF